MVMNSLSIKIADVSVGVKSAVEFKTFNDFGFYKDFIVDDAGPFDCSLAHIIGPPPDFTRAKEHFIFNNWQLSMIKDTRVLRIGPPPRKGKPDNIIVFNENYSAGTMYQESVIELFRRFSDVFIIINLLSRMGGFVAHSSGLVWEGKGLCFLGPSGAGKSTLLDMFKDEIGRESLLNDDRIVIKNYSNKWRMFGTPWYGESRVASPGHADLAALFFIRHAKTNYVRRISAAEAFPQLMVLGQIPVWDGEAMSRVMDTFQDLIRDIPAYEFGFLPEKSAIELIKKTVSV